MREDKNTYWTPKIGDWRLRLVKELRLPWCYRHNHKVLEDDDENVDCGEQ